MERFKVNQNQLWGELQDDSENPKELAFKDVMSAKEKLLKYGDHTMKADDNELNDNLIITLDNPLVTQTVEVINQTELINTMNDTFGNQSEFNSCNINPYTLIPSIDFPPETTENINRNRNKFAKPLPFMPPIKTEFTLGRSYHVPEISTSICKTFIRKSICGLLKIKGFNVITENCLNMFVDGIDEFYRSFMDNINKACKTEHRDILKNYNIMTVEKAYHNLTQNSLLTLHHYYKNEIINRNETEIALFKDKYREYKKLMNNDNKYDMAMNFTTDLYRNDNGSNNNDNIDQNNYNTNVITADVNNSNNNNNNR